MLFRSEIRDADGEIVPTPEPIRIDPDNVDTSPSDREYRDNTRTLVASFDPSHADSRSDPERENVARVNANLTRLEQSSDSQIRQPRVHADHVLAMMVADQKNRLRDTRKRHSRRSLTAQIMNPVRRDPTDSGLHLLAGAAKGFALGWKHSSARSLAMRTLKESRLSQLVEHGMRHGLSDKVLEEMDKIQKDFSKRFQDASHNAPAQPGSEPVSRQTGDRSSAETTTATNAAEPPPVPSADPAQANQSGKDAGTSPENGQAPSATGGEPKQTAGADPSKPNTTTEPADKSSDQDPASRPFRQPWPYNPELIDRVASNPEQASTDELIDAYASAKAELLMMQRLELRLRASATGTPEKELAKLPIGEQKKASGIGLPKAQFERMQQTRKQSKNLHAQLTARGFVMGPLERQIHARTQKLPLTVPGIDPAALLQQAVAQRKDRERAEPMKIDLTGVTATNKGIKLAPKQPVPTAGIAGAISVINALFKQARKISQGLSAANQRDTENSL